MFKLIVGFMGFIVEMTAAALIIVCALLGAGYADQTGGDPTRQWVYAGAGALMGLFIAVIFLGVPVLLLRMNENLDEISSNLRKMLSRINLNDNVPHPLAAAFPNHLISQQSKQPSTLQTSTPSQVNDRASVKACPFCAEPVRKEAIKCKHCGSEILEPI